MNFADFILIVILAAALILAIRKCIRDHKQGKACGGDCSQCNHTCGK